jgi:hypothetical protein
MRPALVPATALALALVLAAVLAAVAPPARCADTASGASNGNYVKPSSLAPQPHTGNSYGTPIAQPILTRRPSTKHKQPQTAPQLHTSPLPGS